MRRNLTTLFLVLCCAVMAQNNVITYTAEQELDETDIYNEPGLYINGFGEASIIENGHTFSNGVGTIVFDRDLTVIDSYAFLNCGGGLHYKGLTSIVIPATVTTINFQAFYYCEDLTTVTFAEGSQLQTIGKNAFAGCKSLVSVSVPASVTAIGDYAFAYCQEMTHFTCLATTPPTIDTHTFGYDSELQYIYVPEGSVNAYKNAAGWSQYADKITRDITQDKIAAIAAINAQIEGVTIQSVINYASYAIDQINAAMTEKVIESIKTLALNGLSCMTTRYSDGLAIGDSIGYARGYSDGLAIGDSIGYARGYSEGDLAGYDRGYYEGDSTGYARGFHEGDLAGFSRGRALADSVGYARGLSDAQAALPTDPEDTEGGVEVVITKGDKTLHLINPDKVKYNKR